MKEADNYFNLLIISCWECILLKIPIATNTETEHEHHTTNHMLGLENLTVSWVHVDTCSAKFHSLNHQTLTGICLHVFSMLLGYYIHLWICMHSPYSNKSTHYLKYSTNL